MKLRRVLSISCVGAALIIAALFAAPASAQAPAAVPIQGILTDANGNVLDGDYTLTLSLYDSPVAATPFFAEVQEVSIEQGVFSVYVGNIETLDLSEFTDKQVYIGIQVGSDPEMSPRLRFGTVPYAAYAEHTTAEIPTGAVMHFDLDDCPAGWSPVVEAAGRAIVGMSQGGTPLGTVGTPLDDLEDRAHGHSVDPASADTSSNGSHSHTVATSFSTGQTAVPHTHQIDPPAHSHVWATYDEATDIWYSGSGQTIVDWTDGMDAAGMGNYPLQLDGSSPGAFTTDSFNQAPFTSGAETNTSHSHSINLNASTSSQAAHTHSVDVPSTATTTASTSSVLPYVQLLVCRKD